MKDLFENDDGILGLVRKEGLLKPSPDFTSRIMQRIEEASDPVIYQPLLSKKAWGFLSGGFILAIALCWYMLSGSSSNTLINLPGMFDRAGDYINRIDLNFKFDANALLIITLAILSMGILLLLDLWLSNNRRQNTV